MARGIGGAVGARNAPAIVNRGYGTMFFWDGRAKTLERQVLEPILNPKELGLTQPELEHRTGRKTPEVTAALASYVRTIHTGNSRFDRYAAGKLALTELEKSGLAIFRGRGNCWICHTGPNFSDEILHNTGVAFRDGHFSDIGAGKGDFKTPTLRDIARKAPYMHDGSIATLEDVIEYYDRGGNRNPGLDAVLRPLHLTSLEKQGLLAFLASLTGRVQDGSLPLR